MIFVIGGTGTIGRGLLAELETQGVPARVLVRDDDKAAAIRARGFEAVNGDLERPAELGGLLEATESVFLLSPMSPRQAELQNGVVDAAKQAGVGRVVKVSGSSAVTAERSLSYAGRAHAQTEAKIRESGLAYTFLRPNYFMQNLLALAGPIGSGVLPVPADGARVAMVDTRDVGAVAAAILVSGDLYDGRVLDLTGPESLDFAEVARRLSRILGREIRYGSPTPEAAAESMRGRGAPDWLVEHLGQIMAIVRSGALGETSSTVQEILDRPPRTLDDFVRDHTEVLRSS